VDSSGNLYGAGENTYNQYESTASPSASASTKLSSPKNIQTELTTANLSIKWDTVENANYYEVTVTGMDKIKAASNSTSVPTTSLTDGKDYTISIVACSDKSETYPNSDAATVTYTYKTLSKNWKHQATSPAMHIRTMIQVNSSSLGMSLRTQTSTPSASRADLISSSRKTRLKSHWRIQTSTRAQHQSTCLLQQVPTAQPIRPVIQQRSFSLTRLRSRLYPSPMPQRTMRISHHQSLSSCHTASIRHLHICRRKYQDKDMFLRILTRHLKSAQQPQRSISSSSKAER